jgi:hypothetical protein
MSAPRDENVLFDLKEMPPAVEITEGENGVRFAEAGRNLVAENLDHVGSCLNRILLLVGADCQ